MGRSASGWDCKGGDRALGIFIRKQGIAVGGWTVTMEYPSHTLKGTPGRGANLAQDRQTVSWGGGEDERWAIDPAIRSNGVASRPVP